MHSIFKRKKSPEQLVKLLNEALDGPPTTIEVTSAGEAVSFLCFGVKMTVDDMK